MALKLGEALKFVDDIDAAMAASTIAVTRRSRGPAFASKSTNRRALRSPPWRL